MEVSTIIILMSVSFVLGVLFTAQILGTDTKKSVRR